MHRSIPEQKIVDWALINEYYTDLPAYATYVFAQKKLSRSRCSAQTAFLLTHIRFIIGATCSDINQWSGRGKETASGCHCKARCCQSLWQPQHWTEDTLLDIFSKGLPAWGVSSIRGKQRLHIDHTATVAFPPKESTSEWMYTARNSNNAGVICSTNPYKF